MHIAILSYNHPEITSQCVHSVLSQMGSEKITLLHNGSLQKHQEQLKERFPNIEHIALDKNKGFSGGANALLTHCFKKSDWILFLTNDTQLVHCPDTTPIEAGFYAPLIYKRNLQKVDSCGGALDTHSGQLRHLKNPNETLSRNDFFYVPGTAFLIHKKIYESGFGFDERFGTYWEDVDLSLTLQLQNKTSLKIAPWPEIKILHRVGKTCHKDPYYSTYLFSRNAIWTFKKQDLLSWQLALKVYASLLYKLLFFLFRRDWQRLRWTYLAAKEG